GRLSRPALGRSHNATVRPGFGGGAWREASAHGSGQCGGRSTTVARSVGKPTPRREGAVARYFGDSAPHRSPPPRPGGHERSVWTDADIHPTPTPQARGCRRPPRRGRDEPLRATPHARPT